MSFFRKIFGLETRSGSLGELERLLASASATASGLSVSPEGALDSPTTLACVRVLAESLGQLPAHVFRRGADGAKDRADDHPVARLLAQPNEWTSGFEFRVGMMTQALLYGAAYAHVGRTSDGRILEVVQAPPRTITREVDPATGEPVFRATLADGTQREVDRRDLLVIRLPGADPSRDLSLVHHLREAIGLDKAIASHVGRLFSRAARPAGALKTNARLNDATAKRLQASLQAMHAGQESGRTIILEEGLAFEQMQFSSVDAQVIETWQRVTSEICRGFRVPLHLAQDWQRATWSNSEHMSQAFLTLTMLPWIKVWEQALARDLLTEDERDSHYIEFLTADLAKADLAARFNAYTQAANAGILTINEIRALESRPPLAGGDTLRTPLNMTEAGGQADAP